MASGRGWGGKDSVFFKRLAPGCLTILQWVGIWATQIGLDIFSFFFFFSLREVGGVDMGKWGGECDQGALCDFLIIKILCWEKRHLLEILCCCWIAVKMK